MTELSSGLLTCMILLVLFTAIKPSQAGAADAGSVEAPSNRTRSSTSDRQARQQQIESTLKLLEEDAKQHTDREDELVGYLIQVATEYVESGNVETAKPYYMRAIKLYPTLPNDTQYGDSNGGFLYRLAQKLTEKDFFDEAEAIVLATMPTACNRETHFGSLSLAISGFRYNGSRERTEALLQKLLVLYKQIKPVNALEFSRCEDCLSEQLFAVRDYANAEKVAIESLNRLETLKAPLTYRAPIMAQLAEINLEQGKYEQAKALWISLIQTTLSQPGNGRSANIAKLVGQLVTRMIDHGYLADAEEATLAMARLKFSTEQNQDDEIIIAVLTGLNDQPEKAAQFLRKLIAAKSAAGYTDVQLARYQRECSKYLLRAGHNEESAAVFNSLMNSLKTQKVPPADQIQDAISERISELRRAERFDELNKLQAHLENEP
jgi:tetratricopeptide (TPR) repeat protein